MALVDKSGDDGPRVDVDGPPILQTVGTGHWVAEFSRAVLVVDYAEIVAEVLQFVRCIVRLQYPNRDGAVGVLMMSAHA